MLREDLDATDDLRSEPLDTSSDLLEARLVLLREDLDTNDDLRSEPLDDALDDASDLPEEPSRLLALDWLGEIDRVELEANALEAKTQISMVAVVTVFVKYVLVISFKLLFNSRSSRPPKFEVNGRPFFFWLYNQQAICQRRPLSGEASYGPSLWSKL